MFSRGHGCISSWLLVNSLHSLSGRGWDTQLAKEGQLSMGCYSTGIPLCKTRQSVVAYLECAL